MDETEKEESNVDDLMKESPISALDQITTDTKDDFESDNDVPTQLLLTGSVKSKALISKFSQLMQTNLVNLDQKWRNFLFWLSDNYITDTLLANNMSVDIMSGNIYVDGQETDDNLYQFVEMMNDQTKQELDINISFNGGLSDFQTYLDLLVTDFDRNDISYSRYCKFLVAQYNFFHRFDKPLILKLRHSTVTDIDISLMDIQRKQWTKFMIVLMEYYLRREGVNNHLSSGLQSPGEILAIFSKYESNLIVLKQGYDQVFITVSSLIGRMVRNLPLSSKEELVKDISTCTGTRITEFPDSNKETARLFIESWYQYGALPPDIYKRTIFTNIPDNAFKNDVLYRMKNDSIQSGYIESITAYGAFCALAVSLDIQNFDVASRCYIDWFNSFTYENISVRDQSRLLVKHFDALVNILERSIDKYLKSKWDLISNGEFKSKDDKEIKIEAKLRSNISHNYTMDNIKSLDMIPSTNRDMYQDNSIYVDTDTIRVQDEVFNDNDIKRLFDKKEKKDINSIPSIGGDDINTVEKTGVMELYVIPDDKDLDMEVQHTLEHDVSYQAALELDLVNRVVINADMK